MRFHLPSKASVTISASRVNQRRVVISAATMLLAPLPVSAQIIDSVEQCRHKLNSAMIQMAGHGEPQTDYCVGMAYDRGDLGLPKDKIRAVSLLQSSARAGYAPAQLTLGEHYAKADGVTQDFNQAVSLWRQGADQGLAGAQNDLGAAYMNGWGVPKNNDEAIKWFRLAAAQGDAKAQNNLNWLEHGINQPKRTEPAQDTYNRANQLFKSGQQQAAAKLFLSSAQAGNSLAQIQIAWQYLEGVGVPQNASEAARWYRKAAELGHPDAMWNLGVLYENGQGVQEDWVEAAKWYQKSADQNDPVGQRNLAFAYQYGIGVPQNRQTAIAWHRRAAASKDSQSTHWARWLADPTNNVGFRNAQERDLYIRGGLSLVSGNLEDGDPAGILFHNETERLAWLEKAGKEIEQQAAKNASRIAEADYQHKMDQYNSCVHAGGGSDCRMPIRPSRPPE
jgi:uncharacterized protein